MMRTRTEEQVSDRGEAAPAVAGNEIVFATGDTPFGTALVARSGRGLCSVALGDDPEELERELAASFQAAFVQRDDEALAPILAEVAAMIANPAGVGAAPLEQTLSIPLDERGTPFQKAVWRALRRIAPGSTTTYAELARRIGRPTAVRAVAGACGANRIAVLTPCHRVVGRDGALTGYRWGIERKRALLAREAG